MNTYTANTLIVLTGTFALAATGAPVNPSSVACKVTAPDGTVVDVSGTITNPSTGTFNATYLPTETGLYKYEFVGSGSVQSAQLSEFLVNQATF